MGGDCVVVALLLLLFLRVVVSVTAHEGDASALHCTASFTLL